jgi:hypothetical protein
MKKKRFGFRVYVSRSSPGGVRLLESRLLPQLNAKRKTPNPERLFRVPSLGGVRLVEQTPPATERET